MRLAEFIRTKIRSLELPQSEAKLELEALQRMIAKQQILVSSTGIMGHLPPKDQYKLLDANVQKKLAKVSRNPFDYLKVYLNRK